MTAALDPTKFAAAKLNLLLGAGLDAELPKLALRVASVLACQYMCARNGGEAWPAIKRLCNDLGVSSERAVRQALYSLLERGHLVAERKAGGTTRYRIAEQYFDGGDQPIVQTTQASYEPGSIDTQAENEPEPQAQIEPTSQARYEPGTQAHHEPTNTGNLTPGIEYRELNSGSLASLAPAREAEIIPIDRKVERFNPTKRKGQQLSIPVEIVESTAEPRGFGAFWHEYPKKVGRLEAAEAFREATRHAEVEEIISGARRYDHAQQVAISDPIERERFTKSAERWLKGRHWRDQHAAPRPAGLGRHAAEALAEAYGDDDWEAM